MKCIYDVLQHKELDVQRVQREIEALHLVIPLLADEAEWLQHGIVVVPSFPARSSPGQKTG